MAKKQAGRPAIKVDLEQVERLGHIQCTVEEIAHILGVGVSTLYAYKGFSEAHEKGKQGGRESLRREQFKKAEEGNTTMLIWLGKQFLEQTDLVRTEHSGPDGRPIEITDPYDLSEEELAVIAAQGIVTKGGNDRRRDGDKA